MSTLSPSLFLSLTLSLYFSLSFSTSLSVSNRYTPKDNTFFTSDDHTRVKLASVSAAGSDYINANYVDVSREIERERGRVCVYVCEER